MSWNKTVKNGGDDLKRRHGASGVKVVIFICLVVLCSLGAWIFFFTDNGDVAQEKIAQKVNREIRTGDSLSVKISTNQVVKLSKEERLFQKTNGFVKAAGKLLTPDGRVLTFPPPKGDEFRIVHSHGKTYKCDSNGNFVDITPKPIFDNAFEENLIGMAIEGGAFLPGMLTGYDSSEIMPLLIKKVEINPDDTSDVVAKKEAVAALKQDIMDYIKEGGTFDEYVMEMRAQSVRERSIKTEGIKEIVRMINDGDTEGAAMFREKFNDMIGKQGMKPVKLPKHIAEALDEVSVQNN